MYSSHGTTVMVLRCSDPLIFITIVSNNKINTYQHMPSTKTEIIIICGQPFIDGMVRGPTQYIKYGFGFGSGSVPNFMVLVLFWVLSENAL